MSTYPTPWRAVPREKLTDVNIYFGLGIQRSRWTTLSGEADEVVRLRAEVKRLRQGIKAIRDNAKGHSFIVYNESIVRACNELLGEKEKQDG